MSPVASLQRLERNLRDAEERFAQTPGGLWLAASAVLEALERLPRHATTAARIETLTAHALGMKAEGDARASRHELAALAEWVELARQRCTLELSFLDLLRTAPEPVASRAALASVVEREQTSVAAFAKDPLTLSAESEALVTQLRVAYPEYDPRELPMEMVSARGKQAFREVRRVSGAHWTTSPFPASPHWLVLALLVSVGALAAFVLLASSLWKPLIVSALVLVAFGLLAASALRRRDEVHLRVSVLEAWGFIKRRAEAHEASKKKLDAWVLIARALGQLDAFRASDPGQSLHAREMRLPALAPWVRTLVGGMDEEQARLFESEE